MTLPKLLVGPSAIVLLLTSPSATSQLKAQAVVSYQQQFSAGWSMSNTTAEAIRERRRSGVAGFNVEPLGGGTTFTLRSQWQLREQGAPFALSIIDVNPEIQIDQTNGQSQSASVQRTSSLYAAPSGPINSVIPIVQLLPGITFSVFTDP